MAFNFLKLDPDAQRAAFAHMSAGSRADKAAKKVGGAVAKVGAEHPLTTKYRRLHGQHGIAAQREGRHADAAAHFRAAEAASSRPGMAKVFAKKAAESEAKAKVGRQVSADYVKTGKAGDKKRAADLIKSAKSRG